MNKAVYELDGRNFSDLAGFIQEFYRVLLAQFAAKWSWSMDAFNDYLSWPSGPYVLVWRHADLSRQRLGHQEMAKWLESRLASTNLHPDNVQSFQACLEVAQRNEGPTLFDFLVEIIRRNTERVDLRLE